MTSLIPWKRIEGPRNGDLRVTPVSQMRWDWDRMFDRILDDVWTPPANSTLGPPLDVHETDEFLCVEAEVPGMDPDKLDISLTGDILALSGEKVDESEFDKAESNGRIRHYSERRYGSFQRSIKLPCPVDPERVSAEHRNGVVTITLQKASTVRPKRIAVKPH